MYKRVPPPGHVEGRQESAVSVEDEAEKVSKPDNIASDQWKKFQELKARRMKECGQTEERRRATMKKKILQTVAKELDKELMSSEEVVVPETSRKRKRTNSHPDSNEAYHVPECSNAERRWNELRPFLDPNPQLRGVEKGRYGDKSKLEEKMDELIERGQYEAASTVSDKLAQRQFATKVAKAFDCSEYSTKMKEEEKRKEARRRKSSSLRFKIVKVQVMSEHPV